MITPKSLNCHSFARPFIALLALVLITPVANADLRFHFESNFSLRDQQKLKSWAAETHAALEDLVGELPFTMHIHFHRSRAREPVPWANTERSQRRQGVHFHVDPSFSLDAFRRDWTAAHEMSHLIIPYVGRSNAWFAEGFASYMQYQVMNRMGVMSKADMERRYLRNLRSAERNYTYRRRAFAQAASRLRSEGKYPTMYWGGAAFFLQANDALMQASEGSLVELLADYVSCCRRNYSNVDALVARFDRLSGTSVFSDGLSRFRSKPGFPDYRPMIPNATR